MSELQAKKKILRNEVVQDIIKIMGLETGKEYRDTKELRYGRMMLMADQDVDGSHIKGLLINFIHIFWPCLLKIPSFLSHFVTPLVKVTSKEKEKEKESVVSFKSIMAYEIWKESIGGDIGAWTFKYYKGLGTNMVKESIEYFNEVKEHTVEFVWTDEDDGKYIDLAFNKKKTKERKKWILTQKLECSCVNESKISFKDFVNSELLQFALADLARSLPSIVDGLKPVQRKILHYCLKNKTIQEIKVHLLSCRVSEESSYHHGEACLENTIVRMSQTFVGKNNINLLKPIGQFGTRNTGGKDFAAPRYINTMLMPITRFIFPDDDDCQLNYLNEDGNSVEPEWYLPVIPLVLVNGGSGIAMGWSSSIPNYNPRDIVANLRRLLNDQPLVPMEPWYRGFKGSIRKSSTGYVATGNIEFIDNNSLRITELPAGCWIEKYKCELEAMCRGAEDKPGIKKKAKSKRVIIDDVHSYGDLVNVDFRVSLTEENMALAVHNGLTKAFKLRKKLKTSNMHLFNADGKIQKYETPEQILQEFFKFRIEFYNSRRIKLLQCIDCELKDLNNKFRFIQSVLSGEIQIIGRKKKLVTELIEKGFDPCVRERDPPVEQSYPEDDKATSNEEDTTAEESAYEYLSLMPLSEITEESIRILRAEIERLETKKRQIKKNTAQELWLRDLELFEEQLNIMYAEDHVDKDDVDTEARPRDAPRAEGELCLEQDLHADVSMKAALQGFSICTATALPAIASSSREAAAPSSGPDGLADGSLG